MSYTSTFTLAPSNSTNTTFKAWVSKISDVIANCGLVLANTSPTDSHNASLSAPTVNNTSAMSEVWRFADALQNTEPVFFKVEYGSGNGVTFPSVWLTIGSGQSGNALTGNTTTRQQFDLKASNTNPMNCYASGDTGRFALALFSNPTANGATNNTTLLLGVERIPDLNGLASSNGVLLVGYSANVGYKQVAWNHTGNVTATEASLGLNMPSQGTGRRSFPTITMAVYPVLHSQGGSFYSAGYNFLGYFAADITEFQRYKVTHYNATHTYIALGDDAIVNPATSPTTGASLLMRYE